MTVYAITCVSVVVPSLLRTACLRVSVGLALLSHSLRLANGCKQYDARPRRRRAAWRPCPAHRGCTAHTACLSPCTLPPIDLHPQAELGDRLARAGPNSEPAALRAGLLAVVGQGQGGNVPLPQEPVHVAYLLAVAVCETCRAVHAPLLPDGGLAGNQRGWGYEVGRHAQYKRHTVALCAVCVVLQGCDRPSWVAMVMPWLVALYGLLASPLGTVAGLHYPPRPIGPGAAGLLAHP